MFVNRPTDALRGHLVAKREGEPRGGEPFGE